MKLKSMNWKPPLDLQVACVVYRFQVYSNMHLAPEWKRPPHPKFLYISHINFYTTERAVELVCSQGCHCLRLREPQSLSPPVTRLLILQSPSLAGIVRLQCVCMFGGCVCPCCDWPRALACETAPGDVSVLIPHFSAGCFVSGWTGSRLWVAAEGKCIHKITFETF